jgi:hypothetical protein
VRVIVRDVRVLIAAALLRKIKTQKESCFPADIAVGINEYKYALSNAMHACSFS